jgi:hypothetical protein
MLLREVERNYTKFGGKGALIEFYFEESRLQLG